MIAVKMVFVRFLGGEGQRTNLRGAAPRPPPWLSAWGIAEQDVASCYQQLKYARNINIHVFLLCGELETWTESATRQTSHRSQPDK